VSETQQHAAPEQPPPTPAGWMAGDLVAGSALVVLLIALFVPWFTDLTSGAALGPPLVSASNGPAAHGFLWMVLALAIASLVLIVTRPALGGRPGSLPSPGPILVGATGIAFVLCLLGVAIRPPGVREFQHLVLVDWSYGGFIAVVAAEVAVAAALSIATRPQPASSPRR
jgi:hypothetical protein